jgi:hypothetical protein
MTNTALHSKEANKVIEFIRDARNGKYTAEKPDLTYVTYARLEIQESDARNILDDCEAEVILYGISS